MPSLKVTGFIYSVSQKRKQQHETKGEFQPHVSNFLAFCFIRTAHNLLRSYTVAQPYGPAHYWPLTLTQLPQHRLSHSCSPSSALLHRNRGKGGRIGGWLGQAPGQGQEGSHHQYICIMHYNSKKHTRTCALSHVVRGIMILAFDEKTEPQKA